MQFAIELPDDLAQKLLQQTNIQAFVQKAIEKMLAEEKKHQARINLFELMQKVPRQASLANELIQERRLEAEQDRRNA